MKQLIFCLFMLGFAACGKATKYSGLCVAIDGSPMGISNATLFTQGSILIIQQDGRELVTDAARCTLISEGK